MNPKKQHIREILYLVEEDLTEQSDLLNPDTPLNSLISKGNSTFLIEEETQSHKIPLVAFLGF